MNSNKKALCFLYDAKYSEQGDQALLSARQHNPDYTIIHLTDASNKNNSLADIVLTPSDLDLNENWLIIGRIGVVEFAIKNLGFDSGIFVDGDTYTYNRYTEFQSELDKKYSLVVIPHITKPLPEDNKYPQTRIISLAGNYNTGFWGATKSGLDFLSWWKHQTALYPESLPQHGLAAEQGWLRFVGDFTDNIKIFRHPGYNVAYWNIKERIVNLETNKWTIDNENLVIIHFSGLKADLDPSHMSIFQNRHCLDHNDPVYKLYSEYSQLVWNNV